VPVLEREPEPVRGRAGQRHQLRVLDLGEVHEPAVVREVHRLELRVAVDAEAADHEPLEVAGEEVGQPERRRLVLCHLGERLAAGEELVAVGAGQPLDALLGDDRVEQAARAAVGVGDEDRLVAVGAGLADPVPDLGGNPLGPVVEVRREAGDVDAGQAAGKRDELAGERPAPDDERASVAGDRVVRRAFQTSIGAVIAAGIRPVPRRLAPRAHQPSAGRCRRRFISAFLRRLARLANHPMAGGVASASTRPLRCRLARPAHQPRAESAFPRRLARAANHGHAGRTDGPSRSLRQRHVARR
jgi:hypothetical protein